MSVPPIDINEINPYQAARLAAATLDRKAINDEVYALELPIQNWIGGLAALSEVIETIQGGNTAG